MCESASLASYSWLTRINKVENKPDLCECYSASLLCYCSSTATAEVLCPHPVLELGACALESAISITVCDQLISIYQTHSHAYVYLRSRLKPAHRPQKHTRASVQLGLESAYRPSLAHGCQTAEIFLERRVALMQLPDSARVSAKHPNLHHQPAYSLWSLLDSCFILLLLPSQQRLCVPLQPRHPCISCKGLACQLLH